MTASVVVGRQLTPHTQAGIQLRGKIYLILTL